MVELRRMEFALEFAELDTSQTHLVSAWAAEDLQHLDGFLLAFSVL